MIKVFVTPQQINQGTVVITGGDAHHLRSVLRKKPDDLILIGVSGGAEEQSYEARIISVEPEQVACQLLERIQISSESPLRTYLYQAVAKGDKMDLIIQKSVELGVTEIIPFFSRYTVVRLEEAKSRQRQERWQKIAEAAAKQCRRDAIPKVHMPRSFAAMTAELAERRPGHLLLLPYEQERKCSLADLRERLQDQYPQEVSIVIGPEGGFCPDEVERIRNINGEIITLGRRILRTETAAVAVLALVQFLWGDLG